MSQSTSTDGSASSSGAAESPAAPPSTGAPSDSSSTPSSGTDSQPSPSSGDSHRSDRQGLLDAVRKVVPSKPDAPAVPSEDADTEPAETAPTDPAVARESPETKPEDKTQTPSPEADADPTEAELKKLRPETRRRFERLLQQRNEARQTVETLQPELAQHRRLQGYLQQNQLAPDDVNTLLGVGAALRRGDYQGFLNGVTPFVMAAQEALGLRVAPDLQKQVNDGTIDEAAARELTRTRHRAVQAEARLKDTDRTLATTQQSHQLEVIRNAVDVWEANLRQRDPDYTHMADAVRRASQGLMQERGVPRTPQEAVALTQAAYDEVRGIFSRARPALRPTRPTPSGIHGATGTHVAEPRTMKEAVLAALQNTRRA
jgi:hypothetical protein